MVNRLPLWWRPLWAAVCRDWWLSPGTACPDVGLARPGRLGQDWFPAPLHTAVPSLDRPADRLPDRRPHSLYTPVTHPHHHHRPHRLIWAGTLETAMLGRQGVGSDSQLWTNRLDILATLTPHIFMPRLHPFLPPRCRCRCRLSAHTAVVGCAGLPT